MYRPGVPAQRPALSPLWSAKRSSKDATGERAVDPEHKRRAPFYETDFVEVTFLKSNESLVLIHRG